MNEPLKGIPPELERVFDFRTAGMTPPHRVVFGFRAIEQIGAEAAKLAKGKALLVSDAIIEKTGTVQRVAACLSSAGFAVETFTGVEPEPHLESADALYEQCVRGGFSLIVGVGGGSVMDLAKLTAQCGRRKRPPREFLDKKAVPESRGIPMILAPTTAGTGSEVSPNLVVAVGEDKYVLSDPYYYPDIALIDPLLTVSMPPRVTASTGIDALSHAIEGMLHKNANPLSDVFCLAGIEMAGGYLRRAVANGEDLEARYYMSMSAALSMMGMLISGALYAHSVAYVISRYKPTPHGVGCGLGLPYTMAFNLPVSTAKLARMAVALGEKTWMLSERDAAKLAVKSLVSLMKDIGLPVTLAEYGGIKESDLEAMADLMMKKYARPMNPRPMSREDSITFWRNMWNGEFYIKFQSKKT